MVLFWSFVGYGFLGYLLEKLFAALTGSERRVRKCRLLLPLCPVYGIAMAVVLCLPPWMVATTRRSWLWGGLAVTAVEYAVHLFYEKCVGVRFWDYTQRKFHVQGRVCLSFSLVWGGLAAAALSGVQPWMERLAAAAPPGLTYVLLILNTADALLSCRVLRWSRQVDWMSVPVLLRGLQGS